LPVAVGEGDFVFTAAAIAAATIGETRFTYI